MSQPVEMFVFGTERIPIFLNKNDKGSFLNAKLNGRGYQDEGQEWRQSYAYTATQLATHIALCQRTLAYMLDNRPENES